MLAVAPLGDNARPMWRWVAAGILSGAMALLKPHFGLVGLVVLVFGWFGPTAGNRWRTTLAWLAGALIPCGACLLWLGRGGLAAFWPAVSS